MNNREREGERERKAERETERDLGGGVLKVKGEQREHTKIRFTSDACKFWLQ